MNRKKQRQKKENLDSNRRTQNESCLTLTLAKRKGPRSYLDLAATITTIVRHRPPPPLAGARYKV